MRRQVRGVVPAAADAGYKTLRILKAQQRSVTGSIAICCFDCRTGKIANCVFADLHSELRTHNAAENIALEHSCESRSLIRIVIKCSIRSTRGSFAQFIVEVRIFIVIATTE